MKKYLLFLNCLFLFSTSILQSCKNLNSKNLSGGEHESTGRLSDSANTTVASNTHSTYHLSIKTDKKKQADLDLPFRGVEPDQAINVIAVGSCLDSDQPQPIWQSINKNDPQLFIFSGITFCDQKTDLKSISEHYRKLKLIPEYRNLREKIPFLAIWGEREFISSTQNTVLLEKENIRTEFLKHWNYLRNTLPTEQKPLYHSKIVGAKKQKVQIILIDTYWDKSEHLISKDQWIWIEKEFRKPAEFRILVSSAEILTHDPAVKKWNLFPGDQDKLLTLIKKMKIKNLIFLSGHSQMATVSRFEFDGKNHSIVELSPGHLNKDATEPYPILAEKNYLHAAYPGINFGLIQINWPARTATLQIKSVDNEVKNSTEVQF